MENLLFCSTVNYSHMAKLKLSTLPARISAWSQARIARMRAQWEYCSSGVWTDTRSNWKTNTIKTINLAVRSFMDTDLQNRASALTYNTLLAIVPAMAMLFAIGRGFGFQNLLTSQLFNFLPAQKKALETAISFVDHYLAQASQGIFVGVGLVFLLWTLISLMSNIEQTFNRIWGVTTDRSMARKIIDYTAILFLLPILMICASGLSLVMSSTMLDNPLFKIFSPALKVVLDLAPFILIWVAFTGTYMLFPNTKVNFKNAMISGIIAGTAFQVLQYLFMSGQLYVSKYNAIYGSFAFLPLLLLWLQLTWTITLAGAVLCYSSQNIFQFSFSDDINKISPSYKRKIALVIITVIVKRYEAQMSPLTITGFAGRFHMPVRLVSIIIHDMLEAGLVLPTFVSNENEEPAYIPALDIHMITIGYVLERLNDRGSSQFIPDFQEHFKDVIDELDKVWDAMINASSEKLLMDLSINIEGTPPPSASTTSISANPK